MSRKTFQIPSVEAMTNFERKPPKFQSNFQPKKQALSTNEHSSKSLVPQKGSNGSTAATAQQEPLSSSHAQSATTNTFRRKAPSSFAAKFAPLLDDGDDLDEGTTSKKAMPAMKPPAAAAGSKNTTKNCILVNPRQRGNPLLKSVSNIPWEFGDIVPDYEMGRTICALFLSLRYHHLNPNYIHGRLKELGYNYELRVLLVQVDVKDPHFSLKELARMALLAECTLILAWSPEEAGRYLETYKSYENKPVDALKERIEQDFVAQVTDCLTTVKSVNKTDVVTLLSTFGSVEKIASAGNDEICLLPGFGPQKAQRLKDIFEEPFVKQV